LPITNEPEKLKRELLKPNAALEKLLTILELDLKR